MNYGQRQGGYERNLVIALFAFMELLDRRSKSWKEMKWNQQGIFAG